MVYQKPVIDESVRMTKRERQVIELIADGDTNKEIAQKLHLSTYTVKSHVHNILEKLALNTRVQIAKHAHLSDSIQYRHRYNFINRRLTASLLSISHSKDLVPFSSFRSIAHKGISLYNSLAMNRSRKK